MTDKPSSIVAVVVDAQNDFMRPDGRLYVRDLAPDSADKGAVSIVPLMRDILTQLRQSGAHVVYTMDWHRYGDAEIDVAAPNPALGTYPPHCMGLAPDPAERLGAEIIPELEPHSGSLVVERDTDDPAAVALVDMALAMNRDICIHKEKFSVFLGNKAASTVFERLNEKLQRPTFVVFGVARDVCVQAAVVGLRDRDYNVAACLEATWGLGLASLDETRADWAQRGVSFLPDKAISLRRPGVF